MATPIPNGIILAYLGLDATSHTGWTRKKALDSYYLYVTTADDAGGTGGASQHNHTETGHNHTFSGAAASRATGTAEPGGNFTATVNHTHGSATSGTTSATISNTTNNPSFIDAIFKSSDGTNAAPPGLCCLWDGGPAPAGWTAVAAADGRLLKGAKTNGGNTGGVTAHTHTQSGHVHTSTSAAAAAPDKKEAAGTAFAADGHTHTQTFATQTATLNSAADNAMPSCQSLMLIENTSGSEQSPVGMIGIWMGTAASIPKGWERLYLDTFADMVRCCTSAGSIGAITGNRQHNHTANSHVHTRANGNVSATLGTAVGAINTADAAHTHAWTVNSATQTINQCTSRAHYPSYTKVILVKKIFDPVTIVIPMTKLALNLQRVRVEMLTTGLFGGSGGGSPALKWEPHKTTVPLLRLKLSPLQAVIKASAHHRALIASAPGIKVASFTPRVVLQYDVKRQAEDDELMAIIAGLISEGILK